jgi:hypothetical protein
MLSKLELTKWRQFLSKINNKFLHFDQFNFYKFELNLTKKLLSLTGKPIGQLVDCSTFNTCKLSKIKKLH